MLLIIVVFFFFCCRPWNWYFSGTTWSSESKADIFCREWQWFQTFSRGISLVYNKHPLLNFFFFSAETVYWSKTSFEFCCISESHWTSFWAEFDSLYYLPYKSYDVSSESLVMDQLMKKTTRWYSIATRLKHLGMCSILLHYKKSSHCSSVVSFFK